MGLVRSRSTSVLLPRSYCFCFINVPSCLITVKEDIREEVTHYPSLQLHFHSECKFGHIAIHNWHDFLKMVSILLFRTISSKQINSLLVYKTFKPSSKKKIKLLCLLDIAFLVHISSQVYFCDIFGKNVLSL
jgi:hypothetical protein